RLAEIMAERSQHNRDLARVRELINQLARSIDRQSRVDEDITFRMPLGILWHIDKGIDLGKEFFKHTERLQPSEPNRRLARSQQQLFQLAPNSFRRQIAEIDCAAELYRFGSNAKLEARGKLRRPQD